MECEVSHTPSLLAEKNEMVWNKGVQAIACERSRPKSLDLLRKGENLWTKFENIHKSFKLLYGLKRVHISSEEDVGENTKSRQNGCFSRPLTWGPNGSKFTTAFQIFHGTDAIFLSEQLTSHVLEDLTNNNVQVRSLPKTIVKNENDKIVSKNLIKVEDGIHQAEKANFLVQSLTEKDDVNIHHQSSKEAPSPAVKFPSSHNTMKVLDTSMEEVVEKVLGQIVNCVVRKEATRKIQFVFEENEKQIELNIQSRKETDVIQSVVDYMIKEVSKMKVKSLNANYKGTDIGPNCISSSEKPLTLNTFNSNKSQFPEVCHEENDPSPKSKTLQLFSNLFEDSSFDQTLSNATENAKSVTESYEKCCAAERIDPKLFTDFDELVETNLNSEPLSASTSHCPVELKDVAQNTPNKHVSVFDDTFQFAEITSSGSSDQPPLTEDHPIAHVLRNTSLHEDVWLCLNQLIENVLDADSMPSTPLLDSPNKVSSFASLETSVAVPETLLADSDESSMMANQNKTNENINDSFLNNISCYPSDPNKFDSVEEAPQDKSRNLRCKMILNKTKKNRRLSSRSISSNSFFEKLSNDKEKISSVNSWDQLIGSDEIRMETNLAPATSDNTWNTDTEPLQPEQLAAEWGRNQSTAAWPHAVSGVVTFNSGQTNLTNVTDHVHENNAASLHENALFENNPSIIEKQKNINLLTNSTQNNHPAVNTTNGVQSTRYPLATTKTSDKLSTSKKRYSLLGEKNPKVFRLLKHFSSCDITPRDKNADVYSEATERVLEEDKSLRRQESFSKPMNRSRPFVRIRKVEKFNDLQEDLNEEANENKPINLQSPSSGETVNSVSDTELMVRLTTPKNPDHTPNCTCYDENQFLNQPTRSRSLPFNIETNFKDIIQFSPVETNFDDDLRPEAKFTTPTTAIPYYLTSFLDPNEDRNRRDSALSRGSAASSGTVVASDNEDFDFSVENKDASVHVNRHSKHVTPNPSPLAQKEVSGVAVMRRKYQIERSQSLDRSNRNSRRLTPYIIHPPTIHRSKCGMILSAPTITVSLEKSNGVQPSMANFDPVMSSTQSLASSTSYMGDESDALRSSSVGSSPLTSPSESPRMSRKKHKPKLLNQGSTRQAERQAAEACDWLKAAGFPQYVQLYEDGHFPLDIAAASSDHNFLGQDDIAALIRRLNVLNKCANLKLDKITSKETQDDNDDEEDLEYALSEFWRIEDGHRWSRMESKSSAIASPSERLSFPNYKNRQDGLNEDSNGDVFSTDEVPRLSSIDRSTNRRRSSQSQAHIEHKQTNLKPKSQSFLKRVGGDLKKFGSFKRKDSQRPVILPISLEDDPPKPVPRNRYKSLRKSRKVEIGDPVLQGGHDKFDQFKCAPIDSSGTGTKEPQRVRKPSSHSLISSSSSSGGASSVSTPASRRTRASIEDFSSDLNDLSPNLLHRGRNLLEMQHPHISSSSKSKESIPDKDGSTFVIPRNYKPGTFPSALREKNDDDVAQPPTTVSARSFSISDSLQSTPTPDLHRKSSRPMSIYDNLPNTGGNISAQDIINLLDPSVTTDDLNLHRDSVDSLEVSGGGVDPAFWSVDDIVEHAQSLQQMVGAWDEDEVDETESKPKFDSIEAILNETVNYPMNPDHLPSYHADNISSIGDDSDSMSRISGEHRNQILLRWEPLRREDSSSTPTSDNLQLHNLSASQLMMLRRLSLLKLTARMEQYALSNNKGSLSWSMPRFIRRIREPDYRDKTVFGVPLLQNVQRIGQPLPICIQHALAYLRRSALDQIGLFRKPGVRGRIHKLRALCELSPEMETFEDCSDYDIADLIKQYFRELPDPLMTMKMSETFVGIFLHVPEDVRLQTLQAAIMLLPDENRETLKTLLNFLADVASRFDENQMNASNLSTCFAPSLFYQQLGNIRLTGSNTTKYKKAMPDMRAMNENKASNECLTFMINHVTELFKISEDAIAQCRMSVMQQSEDVLANEIGYKSDYQHEKDYYSDFHSYVDRAVRETFREEQRFNLNRSWQTVVSNSDCELAYRKLNDGNPLRLWRSKVEINDSDLVQIMDRILNERHLWDEELIQWKVLLQPDERTQLFQMIRSEMSPHPSRDYCVLRSWRSDVKSRGSSVIVEVSTGQPTMLGDVRGVVLMSRYVIEPTDVSGKFNLKHFCRVDTKGRNPEWYNKAYGHMVLQSLLKIKDSLKLFPSRAASFTS